uniref:Uncharacterized protein n=1 Tax=Arundo donax TaxID=35708 RepID=A0A0A9G6K7_ARUDO
MGCPPTTAPLRRTRSSAVVTTASPTAALALPPSSRHGCSASCSWCPFALFWTGSCLIRMSLR